MALHNDFGTHGESAAVRYLVRSGYIIRECDWRIGRNDIDIIAESPDRREMVFFEVKSRRELDAAEPANAITKRKMRSIATCAAEYVRLNNLHHELRFDILSLVEYPEGEPDIEHLVDAFNPCLL